MRAADDATGAFVLVESAFAGGERVIIDCAQAVTIGGADASKDVALGSGFFSLAPGSCKLAFAGCSAHTVSWTERWA